MALTQVKTTGIADDAVTEAKVANDAIGITEMKAGTDGHVITYDASGNPTTVGPGTDGQVLTSTGAGSPPAFEDAVSEGTQVKSTGESGGTKFLREDGDGTCSWQSIPAGVGGATGVAFNDNVKAEFGTGLDFEIFHDGTNSNINNGTGTFKIGCSNNIEINTFDGHHAAKFINDGAVELYHNNNKSLETTADGGVKGQGNFIVATAGRGLQFNASDSGSSEILDDYEEGTYTANLEVTSGSFTGGNSNQLNYVKIGSLVYVNGIITFSSVSSPGGELRFDLPFASSSTGSVGSAKGCCGAIWNYYGASNPHGNYGWYPLHAAGLSGGASTDINLGILGYNGTNSNWGPIGNLVGNNGNCHFSFSYRTA